MSGAKIAALNEGIRALKDEIAKDELASKRVDLAVLTFGEGVRLIHDFSAIDDFDPPVLQASGMTPMGEAIQRAAEMTEQRKEQYKSQGVDYYRPWIFLITDGEPTDMCPGDALWDVTTRRVHEGEANRRFMFFAVAVEPASTELLSSIAPANRPPVRLKGTQFKKMFEWLSKSQAKVSASKIGEHVALETPMAAGWGQVSA
jgi:uncharacterized protein YegL